MKTLRDLDQLAEELFTQCIQKREKQIKLDKEGEKEKLVSYCDLLFQQCRSLQDEGKKQEIESLYFIGCLGKNKEKRLKIYILDQNSFSEKAEYCIDWEAGILSYFEEDKQYIHQQISSEIKNIHPSILERLSRKYQSKYHYIVGQFLRENVKYIYDLKSYQYLDKKERVSLFYEGIQENSSSSKLYSKSA
ncbi:hypothetical protein FACS189418_3850 [Clostridia bacterium]|nr:hypothetical protein FACS189418_3850 [Clostridia bacterium]